MAEKQPRGVDFIVDENGVAKDVRSKRKLTIGIDLDISEAITGLKAVQREAKKATQVLRELETYYQREGKGYYVKWNQSADDECYNVYEVCLSDIPIEYLQRELSKRPNVMYRKKSDVQEAIPRGFSLLVVNDEDY